MLATGAAGAGPGSGTGAPIPSSPPARRLLPLPAPVFPFSRLPGFPFFPFCFPAQCGCGQGAPTAASPPRLQPVWGLRGGLQVQGCSSARPSPGAAVRSPPPPPPLSRAGTGGGTQAQPFYGGGTRSFVAGVSGRGGCGVGVPGLWDPPPLPGGRRLSPSPLSGASLAFATGGSWRELACPGRRARCWG